MLSEVKVESILSEKEIIEKCNQNKLLNSDVISIKKIIKGKVNHIYILTDMSGKSIVFKQSGAFASNIDNPNLAKIQLNKMRNYCEVKALNHISSFNECYVPKVLLSNRDDHYFFMEDISHYIDVRDLILENKFPLNFGEKIATILIDILIESQDRIDKSLDKIIMKDVLSSILFKLPFMKEFIYNNPALVDKEYYVQKLCNKKILDKISNIENILLSNKQTLLNGDLHLGSICYNRNSFKLYDFEFSFIGPIGYDTGKILAHLILGYIYQIYCKQIITSKKILREIEEFFCVFCNRYETNNKNNELTLEIVKSHIISFCGIELISRITGPLQLQYITRIIEENVKDEIQKFVTGLALDFIDFPNRIVTHLDLLHRICEYSNV